MIDFLKVDIHIKKLNEIKKKVNRKDTYNRVDFIENIKVINYMNFSCYVRGTRVYYWDSIELLKAILKELNNQWADLKATDLMEQSLIDLIKTDG